jgi:hypothetical protein
MKKIGIKIEIFILFFLLVGCANNEEYQKYALLKQENAKLIKQANIAINYQKIKADSISNIIKAYFDVNIVTDSLYKMFDERDDIWEAKSNLDLLKTIELDEIDLCCSILEKANTRFGYLLQGKRRIKRMFVEQLYYTNSNINKYTDGLSAKDYISKYLPKDLK